jgi:hypothetical protein
MRMQSLFDEIAPAENGTATGEQAAAAIRGSVGKLRSLVLSYLRHVGEAGATDDQLQTALRMNPSTERPRRGELLALGFIADAGVRRRTATGRWATVWRITPAGLDALDEGGRQ